ncbi:YchJ family protein [Demequina gelatinilytica]|uniref:YchJ family protein n=1 Tax=Demequina gelatinilytica TaxID=1638980 RepID=UPI000784A358|nr:YchJ family metal-binding protein [Demequina gelatinilytica]
MAAACPCGSGASFAGCCRPYLRGEADAPTAEALMRSRYTAFVRRDAAYLASTWHASTRPLDVAEGLDEAEWRGLEILGTTDGLEGDDAGTVTFVAHHATGAISMGQHRETSRFVRVDGRWQYVDGDLS